MIRAGKTGLILGCLGVVVCLGLSAYAAPPIPGIAWLQSTNTTASSANINVTPAVAMEWYSNSVDTAYFGHTNAINPERLTIKQAGDYLVAATLPMTHGTPTVNNVRTCVRMELRVNGSIYEGALGESSYIRANNFHNNSSDHFSMLATNLAVGDYLEVFVLRTADTPAVNVDVASLYVEHIPSSGRTVFAAVGTDNAASNINAPADSAMVWDNSGRKDAGYTFTPGNTNITLVNAGDYLVFVNIPLNSSVARVCTMVHVKLNGTAVPGRGSQGYIRTSDNHNDSSIHWAGLVQANAGDDLTVDTVQETAGGVVNIQAGKRASVYIQKVDTSSHVYYGRGTTNTGGANWNGASAESICWTTDDVIDTATYTHDTGTNPHQVTVKKAGSYMLVYNDALYTNGGNRNNPNIEVQVNGTTVDGGKTRSNYIRDSGNKNRNSSTMLTYLLTDLTNGSIVSVTTQKDPAPNENTATVTANDDAVLFLWRKAPEIGVLGTNDAAITNADHSVSIADGTDFGQVLAGITNEHTFTITNSGSVDLLLSDDPTISMTGSNVLSVSIQPGSSNLSPEATTTFSVEFAPVVPGLATALVSIVNNEPGASPYIFTVQGYGYSPPTIANTAATTVTRTSASLNGDLTSTGGVPTDVWVYLGDNDGQDTNANWDVTNSFGQRAVGALTTNITSGLLAGQTNYYRYYATNLGGAAWASPSMVFTTLQAGVSVTDNSVLEGDTGTTNDLVFNVGLNATSAVDVTCYWIASNGTAMAGSDFNGTNGTLVISSGSTNGTITVEVIGDNLDEGVSQNFTVTITNLTGGTNIDMVATGTIMDDDAVPTTTAPTNSAQAIDGTGYITIGTDVDDDNDNDCSIRVEYSVDGKTTWTNAFVSTFGVDYGQSPNTNNAATAYQIGDTTAIKTTNGANTVTFTWDTQNAGNGESTITTDYVANVWMRVRPNDGTDGDWATNASAFSIDNLSPVVATGIALVDTTPTSGDTSFQLSVAWTEDSPNTNMFGYKMNGVGAYTDHAGEANTASPSNEAFSVTLNGTNYFNAIRCVHTDDFGNTATSEDTTVVYVCPTSPPAPTVNNPLYNKLDVSISTNLTPGLLYAIQCTNDSTYVQSDGTLAGGIYWTNMTAWGATVVVTGLTSSTTYGFQVAAGNPNDATLPTVGENSASAFGADASGTTTVGPAAPSISNAAPTIISPTNATLAGVVVSTGNVPTTVYMYWGDNDGGTNKLSSWDYCITNGQLAEGSFSADVDGLWYGVQYYYRCYATNSVDGVWAGATTNFVTSEPVGPPADLANTTATNITGNSATVRGSLDATQSVFHVTVYWSISNNLDSAAWLNDDTAGSSSLGWYTNVAGEVLSGSASSLTPATNYYYTFFITNVATNIWSSGTNGLFTTLDEVTWPFTETFEDSPSYMANTVGQLHSQHGWEASATNSAEVQTGTVYAGSKAGSVADGVLWHTFTNGTATNVWVDLYLNPAWRTAVGDPTANTNAAAAFYVDGNGNIVALNDSTWQTFMSFTVSSTEWTRVTMNLNYTTRKWALYATPTDALATIISTNLSFQSTATNTFGSRIRFSGLDTQLVSYVDSITVTDQGTSGRPLNVDDDDDSIADRWELAYVGDLATMNDSTDNDGDGLTDRQEWIAGTDPTDSNSVFEVATADLASESSDDIDFSVRGGLTDAASSYAADSSSSRMIVLVASANDYNGTYSTEASAYDQQVGNLNITDVNGVTEAARKYYYVTVSMFGSSVTNTQRWAMYRQDRVDDYKYLVSVPIDYVGVTNNLSYRLGDHLARGLYVGSDMSDTNKSVLQCITTNGSGALTWQEFYLISNGSDVVWWDGSQEADFDVSGNMGFWVTVPTAGERARTNAVFVGLPYTSASSYDFVVDSATNGWAWQIFGWTRAQELGCSGSASNQLGLAGLAKGGITGYERKTEHADLGDQIWVWGENNRFEEYYWLMDGITNVADRNGRWWCNRTGTYADFRLEPGRAYFYRQHDGGTNFVWSP